MLVRRLASVDDAAVVRPASHAKAYRCSEEETGIEPNPNRTRTLFFERTEQN